MRSALALLPSPLLGPSVWAPVADRLRRSGWSVVVPPTPSSAPETPDDVLTWYLEVLADEPVVLVPHSNAGLYVPALTAQRPVAGAVFVDAGLAPRSGVMRLAPLAFLDVLSTKVGGDGLLPVWSRWWPDAESALLFPDDDTRRVVEAEQRRLPLSYFSSSMRVPAGWDEGLPSAYLAFGHTYADERADAEIRGWLTSALAGEHLHMLVDPVAVADEIERLVTRLLSA